MLCEELDVPQLYDIYALEESNVQEIRSFPYENLTLLFRQRTFCLGKEYTSRFQEVNFNKVEKIYKRY